MEHFEKFRLIYLCGASVLFLFAVFLNEVYLKKAGRDKLPRLSILDDLVLMAMPIALTVGTRSQSFIVHHLVLGAIVLIYYVARVSPKIWPLRKRGFLNLKDSGREIGQKSLILISRLTSMAVFGAFCTLSFYMMFWLVSLKAA